MSDYSFRAGPMQKPFISKSLMVRPLYVQLSFALVERLRSGRLKAGDAFPNEIELSREYNLSPGTVRKALDWMEGAKLIVRQQGRGTFVCDPSSDELNRLYERVCDANGAHVLLRPESLFTNESDADSRESERLKLGHGAKVRRIKRVRSFEGVPSLIETSILPTALFSLSDDDLKPNDTLLDLAKRCGVLLGHGEERVSAIPASDELAAALDCKLDEPLLHLDRTVYTLDAEPAEWRISICRASALQYSASIGRSTQARSP